MNLQMNLMGRRALLQRGGLGLGSFALAEMLQNETTSASDNQSALAVKKPHFPAKAKSVIFLFMYGGPSHVDTFDYKPALYPLDGKIIKVKTKGRGGERSESRAVGPKWKFKQYGQCGKWISDLFPHIGQHVDDIAFIHSMTADSPIHGTQGRGRPSARRTCATGAADCIAC